MRTCTHDRDTYTNGGAGTSNQCPECRERICLFCRNVAPESWMSGQCHGCYRINREAARKREAHWDEQRRLRDLGEAWNEGRGSLPSATNPYQARLEAME